MRAEIERRIGMRPTPRRIAALAMRAWPTVSAVLFFLPRHSGNPPSGFAADPLCRPFEIMVSKDRSKAKRMQSILLQTPLHKPERMC